MRFLYVFRKKYVSLIILIFTILLVLFANNNLTAARSGISLWASNVVPSLFPFFVAANLLGYSSVPYYLSKYAKPIMKPLFNMPGIAAFSFIMGLISGFPVGAKITCDLYENKIISKREAETMLCFTNNSSPLFIIGTVGVSFYSSTEIGICLLLCHVLSAIAIGIILGHICKIKERVMIFKTGRAQRHNRFLNRRKSGRYSTFLKRKQYERHATFSKGKYDDEETNHRGHTRERTR